MKILKLSPHSINQKEIDVPIYEMLSHIIANADFKNKIHGAKLSLTKEIYNGEFTNLKTIDSILKKSLKKNNKVQSFDKLLLSIFRCAMTSRNSSNMVCHQNTENCILFLFNFFLQNESRVCKQSVQKVSH